MNPPNRITIVECIKSKSSDNDLAKFIEGFLRDMNFDPIWVGDTPGFILNSILFSLCNSAAYLVNDIELDPHKIDKIMGGVCGFPLPPLKTVDLVGIDITIEIVKNLNEKNPDLYAKPAPILAWLVESGRLGRKTKIGFYNY
jgi:3-hydroxybutyryl-CoA dehydrogenase